MTSAARIAVYCPRLPPARGGLPDQTLVLAQALNAAGADVVVLGRTGDSARFRPVPCQLGVTPLGARSGLCATARRAGAGAILVQYVPFLYARHGIAPALVLALRDVRRARMQIGVVVHEPYVPWARAMWWLTGWPMRWQFRAIVRLAHAVYSPVPHFVELARRAALDPSRVSLAPVGSNIPVARCSRDEARGALRLAPDDVAVGVFSPAASGLLQPWILAAADALGENQSVRWVFFGSNSDTPPRGFPETVHAICLGWREPVETSRVLQALDLAVAPFVDGLTMRRGSVMASLAHGVPVISSRGALFDPAMGGAALCPATLEEFVASVKALVADAARRRALGSAGAAFYAEHASVELLAARVASDLGGVS